jgi:hypothetical protein
MVTAQRSWRKGHGAKVMGANLTAVGIVSHCNLQPGPGLLGSRQTEAQPGRLLLELADQDSGATKMKEQIVCETCARQPEQRSSTDDLKSSM